MLGNFRILATCFRLGTDELIITLQRAIFGSPPPYHLSLDLLSPGAASLPEGGSLWDGFLMAVPRHRRTIESRMKRRYGSEDWPNGRKLIPKQRLFFCFNCGHAKLAGKLCLTCFNKVMEETRRMQEEINQELKLEPRRSEVVFCYENDDKENIAKEAARVVEVSRQRPGWFSNNLLQRVVTAADPATAEVRPSDLA